VARDSAAADCKDSIAADNSAVSVRLAVAHPQLAG
jgi:hypothetical protein